MSIVVTNTVALNAAITAATAGDTILLAPGNYDWLYVGGANFSSQVTIESQDPSHVATIQGINIQNSSGLDFKDLHVNLYVPQNGGFYVTNSSNITADDLTIVGNLAQANIGPGVAIGTSSNIKILNSDISAFGAGISESNNNGILIQGNVIHDVSADGIDNVQTGNVTIANNIFTNFQSEPGAHADAIQFWTTGTTTSSHDITITGNVFTRGDGDLAQGIFMGNENNIQYVNVNISNNAIEGGMYNGIYVEYASGVTIDHNLVDGYSDETSWIYLDRATTATVENNSANIYKLSTNNTGLVTSNNNVIGQAALGDTSVLHNWESSASSSATPPATAPAATVTTTAPTSTVAVVSSTAGASTATTTPLAASSTGVTAETLASTEMNVTLQGGAGDDSIVGGAGHNYLRGGAGDDQIVGGAGFDDINGNTGNDTIDGGSGGSDWLLGGQGNDLITAHHSDNLIYGNLGNDTLIGGDGADTIRGGQGDDVIVGGPGNNWLSGDLGDDTMTGGPGADIFHTFIGTGVDVVTDFSAAQGDRVQLDPGTAYTVTQASANVVISLGTGGDEMILQNVKLAQLPSGWIFGA